MNNSHHWKYANLVLRVSLGIFIVLWGVDKIVASNDTVNIFSYFYKLPINTSLAVMIGVAEILLGLAILMGFQRKLSYGLGLIAHLISTVSSWKQMIDPWGLYILDGKNSHLFLAAIPVLAAFIVLYMNRDDSNYTLDSLLKK